MFELLPQTGQLWGFSEAFIVPILDSLLWWEVACHVGHTDVVIVLAVFVGQLDHGQVHQEELTLTSLTVLSVGARVLDKPTCRVYYVMWKLSCLSEAYPLTESYYRLWGPVTQLLLLPHPNPMPSKTCVGWVELYYMEEPDLSYVSSGQGVTHHIEGTAQQPHQIPTFPTNVNLWARRGPLERQKSAGMITTSGGHHEGPGLHDHPVKILC